jgi:hypothetical protein
MLKTVSTTNRDVSGRRTASFGELKEAKCETAFIGI